MSKRKKYIFVLALFLSLAVSAYFFFSEYIMKESASVQEASSQIEPSQQEPPPPPPEEDVVSTGIVSESDVESENAGSVIPPIWGDYTSTIGFANYIRAMQSRGCVVFFFSKMDNTWKQIDFFTGRIDKFSVDGIGKKWGAKPSSITKEPMLQKYIKNEVGNTDVFLAKPTSMETLINETIRKKLTNNGIKISDITGIKGVYQIQANRLFLKVNSVIDKSVGAIKFDCIIEI